MAQHVILEFARKSDAHASGWYPSLVGSDASFFIDGRWNTETTRNRMYDHAASVIKFRGPNYRLIGYSVKSGMGYRFVPLTYDARAIMAELTTNGK